MRTTKKEGNYFFTIITFESHLVEQVQLCGSCFDETSVVAAGLLLWQFWTVQPVENDTHQEYFFRWNFLANAARTPAFLSCQMFCCLHDVTLPFCHMWQTHTMRNQGASLIRQPITASCVATRHFVFTDVENILVVLRSKNVSMEQAFFTFFVTN